MVVFFRFHLLKKTQTRKPFALKVLHMVVIFPKKLKKMRGHPSERAARGKTLNVFFFLFFAKGFGVDFQRVEKK